MTGSIKLYKPDSRREDEISNTNTPHTDGLIKSDPDRQTESEIKNFYAVFRVGLQDGFVRNC